MYRENYRGSGPALAKSVRRMRLKGGTDPHPRKVKSGTFIGRGSERKRRRRWGDGALV